MPDEINWALTTYEGNRRRQHEEFRALTFREKLAVIEELELIASHFSPRRASGDALNQAPGAAEEVDHE